MSMQTLAAALDAVAATEPGLPCIAVAAQPTRRYHPHGIEWSYGEVAGRVQQLVDRYAACGWGRGHRVALLLENRPEFMLHFLALNAIGAWVVPLNPDYRQDDLAALLEHAEPDLVVALAERCEFVEGVRRQSCSSATVIPEADFLNALPSARRAARAGSPTLEDEAVLLYTSGTSGMPKGCLIGNDYFFFAGQRYLGAGGRMKLEHGAERLYNPLPLFYANSLVISNPAMILSRNTMIIPDRFHPSTWWQELVTSRATMVHYLGLIPPVLLARQPVPEERMHAVRFGVGAGADPAQRRDFEARFGIPLVEVWGMSEVGISTAVVDRPADHGRAIGVPLSGIELRVLDDQGQVLPPLQSGELVMRREGPNPRAGLFRSYFKDDAGTQDAWRDGWFHTGDIVQQEVDGSYTFVDRKKHMVRRSGQNIAAAEVELCLSAHPAVRQVAVIAVPDEMREEEVLACVITNETKLDPEALARELQAFALERLAYFKVPAWVFFVDSLPTTATQKLRKVSIFAAEEDPRKRAGMIDLRPGKDANASRKRGTA